MCKKDLIEALANYGDYDIIVIFGTDEKIVDIRTIELVRINEDFTSIIGEGEGSDESPVVVCLCAEIL
jgi:hypothetical protein